MSEINPQGQHYRGASGRAITAFVLGILSIICMGFFAGIPAIILGVGEVRAVKSGNAPEAGEGLAKAGYILGIIGTSITLLAFLFGFIFFLMGLAISTGTFLRTISV